jgi:hypothetical protein
LHSKQQIIKIKSMKVQRKKVGIKNTTTLRVVKSVRGIMPATNTQKLANTAWSFAYTALWNNAVFSANEVAIAKEMIKQILVSGKTPVKNYNAFCQRVLLARQYVNSHPNRYIPLPTIWLDGNNATGYVGTQIWYDNILEIRASLPNYKTELKAFAEAILEMHEEPTSQNFHYWRNYFIDNKTTGLLTLFLSTVANQQFGL